jgi:hypothetical protein
MESTLKMRTDPETEFTLTPRCMMRYVDFMRRLDQNPTVLLENLFFPEFINCRVTYEWRRARARSSRYGTFVMLSVSLATTAFTLPDLIKS